MKAAVANKSKKNQQSSQFNHNLNQQTQWNFSNKKAFMQQLLQAWIQWKLGYFDPSMPITRLEFAVLLNATLDPFNNREVNYLGQLN